MYHYLESHMHVWDRQHQPVKLMSSQIYKLSLLLFCMAGNEPSKERPVLMFRTFLYLGKLVLVTYTTSS